MLLILTGCGTFNTSVISPELNLSEKDKNFAKALAHFSQGLILEKELGRHSANTIKEFSKAVELDPESHKNALSSLKDLCKEKPDSAEPQVYLAYAYQVTGNSELAIKHYRKAIEIKPKDMLLYVTVAGLLFECNEDTEAIATIEEGINRTSARSILMSYIFEQGRVFVEKGDIKRSIPCFQFFIGHSHASLRGALYHKLAELYELLGDEAEALRNFKSATKETPAPPLSFIKLAMKHVDTEPEKALSIIIDGNSRIPDEPLLLSWLGLLYSTEKQYDKAIEIYKMIEDIASAEKGKSLTATYYINYGSACERAGQTEKAVEILEQCISLYPEAHQALNYLAYMWAEDDSNLDKAFIYVTKALALEPDNAAYIDTLGWIYFKQNKYEQALKEINRALELLKDDPEISKHKLEITRAMEQDKQ